MKPTNRRKFLETCSVAGASSLFLNHSLSTASGMGFKKRAEHVISIWLGGGMSQIDTFDPKVQGDPVAKNPAPITPPFRPLSKAYVLRNIYPNLRP